MTVTFDGTTVSHTPEWVAAAWRELKESLLAAVEGWEVWTEWYHAILEGRPLDPDLELDKVRIPEDVWKQGAAIVNAVIPRLIEEHRASKDDPRSDDGRSLLATGRWGDSGFWDDAAAWIEGGLDPSIDEGSLADERPKIRPLSVADFRYDADAHAMRMVPFPEDVPALDDAALRRSLADRLSELRDACLDLAEDILLDMRQVPGSLGRDLTRYAQEAALGPEEARPGRLRWLGEALVRAQKDEDIGFGLGDYLRPKLDEIVASHLRLQATFHTGMLERMARLADARLDATPEQAEAEVRGVLETMQSEAWRDLPRIPDEFPEIVEQQLEQLRDMAAAIDLKPEGEERRRLIRLMEEGHITLVATMTHLLVRTLEVVSARTGGRGPPGTERSSSLLSPPRWRRSSCRLKLALLGHAGGFHTWLPGSRWGSTWRRGNPLVLLDLCLMAPGFLDPGLPNFTAAASEIRRCALPLSPRLPEGTNSRARSALRPRTMIRSTDDRQDRRLPGNDAQTGQITCCVCRRIPISPCASARAMLVREAHQMSTRRFAVVLSIDVVGYSRMMQRDAPGLLAALNSVFRSMVRPMIAAQGGRIVKLMGDGALVEFPSAFGGLVAAVEIQRAMAKPHACRGVPEPIRLRMGLHAGDVLVEGDDIFGDCVNIAQRLQAAAEPGGVLLSGIMAELAGGDLPCRLRAEGRHEFHNIARPVETYSVDLFERDAGTEPDAEFAARQEIRFCRTGDGLSLAWTATGEGPTVVRAPHWISHLGLDWQSTHRRLFLGSLSRRFRLVRYDARGNGLSSREVEDISFDRFVDDLETVYDAAGIERAPIFAMSQGCAIAVAFAARAPERVSGIVMIGGYPQGRRRRASNKSRAEAEALKAMIGAGWDDPYPSLRDLLAERIIPMASIEERRGFAEQMRQMMSAEALVRYRDVLENMDVTDLLGRVRARCLVIHCTGDRMQPIEQGQILASGIPNARFISYDSPNHVFSANDPCWPAAEREIHAFLAEIVAPASPAP